jgi:hypothetical protein
MAYGQIDPARLEGEALRRWYLRSPADIENERQDAAAQRYDTFFSRSGPSLDAASRPQDATRSQKAPASEARQVAPHAADENCVGCHGRLPRPPLPPPFGTFPFPSGPLFRDVPNSPPGAGGSDRKQCEIQAQSDDRICGSQPRPKDIAICRASASRRRAHCQRSGEVGFPSLDTAGRIGGW